MFDCFYSAIKVESATLITLFLSFKAQYLAISVMPRRLTRFHARENAGSNRIVCLEIF